MITADRLVAGVQRRISLPTNQALLDQEDILELADDMIRAHFVPLLVSLRENYFVTEIDQAITADLAEYDIPSRAAGLGLRDIKLRIATNNVVDLSLIEVEDEHKFSRESGTPRAVFFKNDQYVLRPPPSDDSHVIEQWIDLRPSNLTLLENAAKVVSFDTTTVTCEAAPAALPVSTVIDFVRGKTNGRVLALEKTVTNVAGVVFTFASGDIPSTLAVGDYLSAKETSPILQLPDDCQPLLETLVARRCTGAIGDYEAKTDLSGDEKAELEALKIMLTPRIRGEQKKIVNMGGLLRGRGRSVRRGYYR
jgi:hypothetical protein